VTLDQVPLETVDRGYQYALQIRALIRSVVATAAAVGGDLMAQQQWGWPGGVVAGPVLLIALWSILIAPGRVWRRIGYAYTGTELHVAQGWLYRIHGVVPVSRVQHIDIAQGLIDRWFGIATLVIHTAGSGLTLPGLSRADAEAIRDQIRPRITGEPW
jgi:uncharacterized protein